MSPCRAVVAASAWICICASDLPEHVPAYASVTVPTTADVNILQLVFLAYSYSITHFKHKSCLVAAVCFSPFQDGCCGMFEIVVVIIFDVCLHPVSYQFCCGFSCFAFRNTNCFFSNGFANIGFRSVCLFCAVFLLLDSLCNS